jgi:hypothetical protein
VEPPQDLNRILPGADNDDGDVIALQDLVGALDRLYARLQATADLVPAVLPAEPAAVPCRAVRRELDALEAAAYEYAQAYERVKRRGLLDREDPPGQGGASG